MLSDDQKKITKELTDEFYDKLKDQAGATGLLAFVDFPEDMNRVNLDVDTNAIVNAMISALDIIKEQLGYIAARDVLRIIRAEVLPSGDAGAEGHTVY